ncbi:hypothetical protein ABZ639_11165 [Saccharomonospora sp. NPDC006951]
MTITSLAGLGGIGFVVMAIVVNAVYLRAGLPLPTSGLSLEETPVRSTRSGTSCGPPPWSRR